MPVEHKGDECEGGGKRIDRLREIARGAARVALRAQHVNASLRVRDAQCRSGVGNTGTTTSVQCEAPAPAVTTSAAALLDEASRSAAAPSLLELLVSEAAALLAPSAEASRATGAGRAGAEISKASLVASATSARRAEPEVAPKRSVERSAEERCAAAEADSGSWAPASLAAALQVER